MKLEKIISHIPKTKFLKEATRVIGLDFSGSYSSQISYNRVKIRNDYNSNFPYAENRIQALAMNLEDLTEIESR